MRPLWPLLLFCACASRKPADLLIEPIPPEPTRPPVEWRTDGDGALEFARAQGKPALLYFTAHW